MTTRNFFMRNEGTADRLVRIVAGSVLLALALTGPKNPLGYIGLLPLITGLLGTCPLYSLFGLSTCRMKGS